MSAYPGWDRHLGSKTSSLFSSSCPTIPVVELAADPKEVPYVNYSDHWPFQEMGWPALMVTDTGPPWSEHYHTAEDSIEKLDFEKLSVVTIGLAEVLRTLSGCA